VALFLAPTVIMLTTTFFTPQGGQPLLLFETKQEEFCPYPFPDLNLQNVLERNYKAIHEAFEALLTSQQVSFSALFAVAFTETLPEVVSAVASLFSPLNSPCTSPRLGIRFCRLH
jgi:hypothetical protein